MQNKKILAVYLDHSQAILFNYGTEAATFLTIDADAKHQIHSNENQRHNAEQQLTHKYYEKIGSAVLDFDSVLIFGPTDAKTELFNYLSEIKKFGKVVITVIASDKLLQNQQLAFVNDHFANIK